MTIFARVKAQLLTRRQADGGGSIHHRLFWGTAWSLLGTIVSRGFSIVSAIIVARILGKADFGVYGMIQSTLSMFGVFAGLAMGSTVTKYLAEYRITDKVRAGRILGLATNTSILAGSLMALMLVVFAPWLARETLKDATLSPVLITGALLLLTTTLNNVQVGSLAGFEAFKTIARINVIQGASTPVLAVPLVYGFGVQGGIMALIGVAVIGYILCRWALLAQCRQHGIAVRRFDRDSLREWPILVKYALPAMLAGVLVMPVTWLCNTILINQPNGYADLGLFNAANQWRQLILFVPQILGSVMLPIFSEIHGRANDAHFTQALALNLRLTWIVALPTTAIVIALHKPLALLFGAQFVGMEPMIVLLVLTCFLYTVNNVVGTALAGCGQMWMGALFNMVWAVALIIASWYMVPRWGGLGLAYAYLAAYLLHSVGQMVFVEIRLAPKAIAGQSDLILLTLATLGAATLTSQSAKLHYPVSITATCLTTLPLLRIVARWLSKTGA